MSFGQHRDASGPTLPASSPPSDVGAVTVNSIGNIATEGAEAARHQRRTIGTPGGGAITISSIGNIATAGDDAIGINRRSNTPITITSVGNIATYGYGAVAINAQSGGNVTITSFGDIARIGDMPIGALYPHRRHQWLVGVRRHDHHVDWKHRDGGDDAVGISAVAG